MLFLFITKFREMELNLNQYVQPLPFNYDRFIRLEEIIKFTVVIYSCNLLCYVSKTGQLISLIPKV